MTIDPAAESANPQSAIRPSTRPGHPEPARGRYPPDRLVVLAPNWLGDAVMALPAIAALRAWQGEAHLAVAARAAVAPLLALQPGIDEVVTLEGRAGWRAAFGSGADVERLAAGKFGAAVLLPNSLHAAWLARRAGIA